MRKGISPVVATVLLVSIAVGLGLIIYWWATGLSTTPSGRADEPYEVDVAALNWTTGEFAVSNVDYRDMPAMSIYIAQNKTKTCALPALTAGSSHTCTFGAGLSGQVTFMGSKVKALTLYH